MDNSEIHFCSECQNMTYLYLDDTEDKNLIHYCKACQNSEPFKGENNSWVQLYKSKTDLQYGINVLDWTKRAVERIHKETGFLQH